MFNLFKKKPVTVKDVQRINLKPGDVLFVTVDNNVSKVNTEIIHKSLKRVFPRNEVIVSSGQVLDLKVVDGK